MSKQLEFSTEEEEVLSNAIMAITIILFNKMDSGVKNPSIQGTNEQSKGNKILVFEIKAKNSTKIKHD